MNRHDHKSLRRALSVLLAAGLLLLALPQAWGQQGAGRLVESVERHRAKIEGLIDERLSALVPSQNYVLRVDMETTPVKVAPPGAPPPASELPGFRAATREATAQQQDKFRIDRISIRIVLNDTLPASDVEYLRTVVPILADFDPAAGDRLTLQVMPQTQTQPSEQPTAEAASTPLQAKQTPQQEAAALSLRDWVLLGVLMLILLVLLIVMIRVFVLRKPQPAPPPMPVARPRGPTIEEISAEERRRQEEAVHLQEVREQLAAQRDGLVKRVFARGDMAKALIDAWQDRPDDLNGLIHGLGPNFARKVMIPHLGAERYQSLEKAVLGDDAPDADSLLTLLREANLFLVAQEIAEPEQIRPDPFAFLNKLSRGQIAFLVKEEPIKIKALVLSRINPKDTATIMESFPKDLQLELAVHIGNLQDYPLEAAENVARELAEKVRFIPDSRTVDIEGPRSLVDLMGRTTPATSKYLLQAMKAKDTKLSAALERRFFLFEALPLVPDELLPPVVRTMNSTTVVQALQGADPDLQRKVIMAFPERARTGMVTSLRAAEYDEETVFEARRAIVSRFQALAEEGKIDLKLISDAWQSGAAAS